MSRRLILLVALVAIAIAALVATSTAQSERCYSNEDARRMTGGAKPYCVQNEPTATLPR